MNRSNIFIAAVLESKPYENYSLQRCNIYHVLTKDGNRSGGGTAEVELLDVYINSCEPRYLPDISPLLLGNNRLVLGDFNTHREFWPSILGRRSALAEHGKRGCRHPNERRVSQFARFNYCVTLSDK